MTEKTNIVKKRTPEFKQAQQKYLELFFKSNKEDYVPKGIFEFGEHKGKHLGDTSKKIQEAKLPMPFGCADLFIQPTTDDNNKVTGIIWFCDRAGCICVCCREDFTGEKEQYPTYCPDPHELDFAESCDCGSSTCDTCNPFWEDEDPDEWEEEY